MLTTKERMQIETGSSQSAQHIKKSLNSIPLVEIFIVEFIGGKKNQGDFKLTEGARKSVRKSSSVLSARGEIKSGT